MVEPYEQVQWSGREGKKASRAQLRGDKIKDTASRRSSSQGELKGERSIQGKMNNHVRTKECADIEQEA